ncbi:hypothetical protein RQP54_00005 [Curvibacter sp. APW13]|uniref:hypothetical protein n=1 Tax=Curvibacter sp. APW13 TaxID=3077236 RepID=UPI0028DF48E2|nr:hypothetical protein [Curvibacter sp. APW13]MDT8989237.1 hypothetical protein [Curvibacter sp. APW13]
MYRQHHHDSLLATLRGLALFILASASPFALSAQAIDGVWGVEEWNCGGGICSEYDINKGIARRTIWALKLTTVGNKVCGTWHSHSSQVYRGFIQGQLTSVGASISLGEEIDHNAYYYEAKRPEEFPTFKHEAIAIIGVIGARLLVAKTRVEDRSQEVQVVAKLSPKQLKFFGLNRSDATERWFVDKCLKDPT